MRDTSLNTALSGILFFSVFLTVILSCGRPCPENAKQANAVVDSVTRDSAGRRIVTLLNHAGKPLTQSTYYLDSAADTFMLCAKVSHVYDSLMRISSTMYYEPNLSDMTVRPIELCMYTYDTIGRVTDEKHLVSSGQIDQWQYTSREYYRYRDTLLVGRVHYNWDTYASRWLMMRETHLFYDSTGRLANSIEYTRDMHDTSQINKQLFYH